MELYPLVMEPSYRSGQETPWGGHSLRDKYRKKTPDEKTGESLEISALPGHESRVANGANAAAPPINPLLVAFI